MLLAVGSVATVLAVAVPGSSSADPTPSIEQVRAQVDRLGEQAEQAAERSNGLHERMKQIKVRVRAIEANVAHQRAKVDGLRQRIVTMAAADYRSGSFDPTVRLLLAKSPDEFLDQVTSAQALAGQRSDALTHLLVEQKRLTEQEQARQAELTRYRAAQARAAQAHRRAVAKVEKAQQLLDRLTEEQRQRMLAQQRERERTEARTSRDGGHTDAPSTPAPVPAPSDRAAQAVAFAQAQLGEPYVFGGAGPDSWDCSGLTMMAWQSAGVSLPHSAHEQYAAVPTKVSMSQLQPGDLVMYYSTMHHVGIYVGNGQIIHAPRPGESVQYAPVDSMPFAGAVRPG